MFFSFRLCHSTVSVCILTIGAKIMVSDIWKRLPFLAATNLINMVFRACCNDLY